MSVSFSQPSSGGTFPAKYPGTCEDCGGEFERGTEIRYASGDLVIEVLDSRPMKVCQTCFLVHAGECF